MMPRLKLLHRHHNRRASSSDTTPQQQQHQQQQQSDSAGAQQGSSNGNSTLPPLDLGTPGLGSPSTFISRLSPQKSPRNATPGYFDSKLGSEARGGVSTAGKDKTTTSSAESTPGGFSSSGPSTSSTVATSGKGSFSTSSTGMQNQSSVTAKSGSSSNHHHHHGSGHKESSGSSLRNAKLLLKPMSLLSRRRSSQHAADDLEDEPRLNPGIIYATRRPEWGGPPNRSQASSEVKPPINGRSLSPLPPAQPGSFTPSRPQRVSTEPILPVPEKVRSPVFKECFDEVEVQAPSATITNDAPVQPPKAMPSQPRPVSLTAHTLQNKPLPPHPQALPIPPPQTQPQQIFPPHTQPQAIVPPRPQSQQILPSHVQQHILPPHPQLQQVIPPIPQPQQIIPPHTQPQQVLPFHPQPQQSILPQPQPQQALPAHSQFQPIIPPQPHAPPMGHGQLDMAAITSKLKVVAEERKEDGQRGITLVDGGANLKRQMENNSSRFSFELSSVANSSHENLSLDETDSNQGEEGFSVVRTGQHTPKVEKKAPVNGKLPSKRTYPQRKAKNRWSDSDLSDMDDFGAVGFDDDDMYFDDGEILETELGYSEDTPHTSQDTPCSQATPYSPRSPHCEPVVPLTVPATIPAAAVDDGALSDNGAPSSTNSMIVQPDGTNSPGPALPPFLNPIGGGLPGYMSLEPQYYTATGQRVDINGNPLNIPTFSYTPQVSQRQNGITPTDDFDQDEEEFRFDDDDFDETDDIIAAANAEALANDNDGYYGQEFGFYASSSASSSSEYVAGGYFGQPDFRNIPLFRQPSLTPISERSECSYRNSLVFPLSTVHSPVVGSPLYATSFSNNFAPQNDHSGASSMQQEEIALGQLIRNLNTGAMSPYRAVTPAGLTPGSIEEEREFDFGEEDQGGDDESEGSGGYVEEDYGEDDYYEDGPYGSEGEGEGEVVPTPPKPVAPLKVTAPKTASPPNDHTEAVAYIKDENDGWVLEKRRGSGIIERQVLDGAI